MIEDEKKRCQRLRNRTRRGALLEPVGVDQGKALVYSRLKLVQPGPGYIHFVNDPAFDEEYFAQLAAEKLVTKVRGTRPYQEWVQMRPRNEALDCMVYATAAMRLSRKSLDGPPVSRPEAPSISQLQPHHRLRLSSRSKNLRPSQRVEYPFPDCGSGESHHEQT